MTPTEYVRTFIEKYIDLIEDNKWEEFYHICNSNVRLGLEQSFGLVTAELFDAGIVPHEHMDVIPESYLHNIKGSGFTFDVPSCITTIDQYAFAGSNIEKVIFHEGLKYIHFCAFRKCENLEFPILLPRSLEVIANDAFDDIAGARFLVYEGSIGQKWCNDNMYSWELVK